MSANTRYTGPQRRRSSPPAARTSTSTSRGPTGERLATVLRTRSPPSRPAPRSSCTCRWPRQDFAAHWNAAQALAGPQLALGANSPFFFGQRLWAETRIELFSQATDTRAVELKNQGVRPRVFFGERWITSIFDLFEENVRYFPALLPEISDEDPVAVLERGRGARAGTSCGCTTAPSTAGTGPIYDIVGGPAAPAGREPRAAGRPDHRRRPGQRGLLLRRRCGCWPPRTGRSGRKMSFAAAEAELPRRRPRRDRRAALLARLRRGRGRRAGAAPPAAAGPRGAGAVGRVRRGARPLPRRSIEGRCTDRRATAPSWQVEAVASGSRSAALDRHERAAARCSSCYIEGMHANEPVHTWPLP